MKHVHLLLSVALAAGCISPVVGAECADGYAECGASCVDLSSDPMHCGACDNACAADAECSMGICVPPDREVGVVDAGPRGRIAVNEDPTPRAVGPEPRQDRPPPTEPPPPGCDLRELSCGDVCVRPETDPSNCGGCEIVCAANEVCAGGSCLASCEEPFELCGVICADTRSDPDHCGGCGVRCATGVCDEGECRAPLAGHIVIIGHDYTTRRDAMSRVLGNAVFLARGRTLDVVTFEGSSAAASRTGTNAAIDMVATETGRGWTPSPVVAAEMSYHLAFADALLVYAQPDLVTGDGLAIGGRWAKALGTFLAAGGTLVVLVGGEGLEGGTLPILEGASLLSAPVSRTDISGGLVNVTRPGDAVAIGVPLTYRAETSTVRFDMSREDAVVEDAMGPVVLHRTVVPEAVAP